MRQIVSMQKVVMTFALGKRRLAVQKASKAAERARGTV
jgi:hypothetical protein